MQNPPAHQPAQWLWISAAAYPIIIESPPKVTMDISIPRTDATKLSGAASIHEARAPSLESRLTLKTPLNAWTALVGSMLSRWARRKMRLELPPWARAPLEPRKTKAYSLSGELDGLSNFIKALSDQGTHPLHSTERERFMGLWALSGAAPEHVAMSALAMRDPELAREAGRVVLIDLNRAASAREIEIARTYRRSDSASKNQDDIKAWEGATLGMALERMAGYLDYGAGATLACFLAQQEALALGLGSKESPKAPSSKRRL